MVNSTNTDSVLQEALDHYRDTTQTYLDQLIKLIEIPSISFPEFPRQALDDCAEAITRWLKDNDINDIHTLSVNNSAPYILANIHRSASLPTVLLYAHYDVQPQLRKSYWDSEPFEGKIREGRLYGRGSADDKAGVVLHIASLLAFLKTTGECPVNIQLLLEGEEETGSPNMAAFLENHGEKIHADCVVVADSANFDVGVPGLTTSLRGLVTIDVTVSALKSPLHSGMWGGPIPDPVFALSKILSSLMDDRGLPTIPELLEMAEPIEPEEAIALMSLPMTDKLFRKQCGLLENVQLHAKDSANLLRIWRQPAITINAIEAGGHDAGNVLMDKAWARVGIRLVPGMNPEKSTDALIKHIHSNCPWGLKIDIKKEPGAMAWKTDISHPVFKIATQSLEEAYQHPVYIMGSGGSIPLVVLLSEHLHNPPILLTGVEDPYTNAHSENESLHIEDFHKSVEAQIRFLYNLGKSKTN